MPCTHKRNVSFYLTMSTFTTHSKPAYTFQESTNQYLHFLENILRVSLDITTPSSFPCLCANISKELTNNYAQAEILYLTDKTELSICPRNPHATELQSQLLMCAICCSCWFLCIYHTFHVAHYMRTLYMWNEPTNTGLQSWSVYTYESGNVCKVC